MRKALIVLLTVGLLAPAAFAQIVSPDGVWFATIDPNNTGQITALDRAGTGELFETLFYEASDANGGLTWRVENNYQPVSQNIGPNSASFVSMRSDGNIRLDTVVTMLSGASGGASITTTYTNVSADGRVKRLKPFIYADLDVNGTFGGDFAQYLGASNAIEQSDSGDVMWMGGAQVYKSWEIQVFAGLRTSLDNGTDQLTNSGGGGPDDFTGALAGAAVVLEPGQSVSLHVGIGGAGIPEPATLTLLGLGTLALIRRR